MEQRRGQLSATVLVSARHVPAMQAQIGRQCEVDGALDDGRVRVFVSAPTPTMIAQHLAGWGAAIEVLEPDSVRAELARLGSELVTRYQ